MRPINLRYACPDCGHAERVALSPCACGWDWLSQLTPSAWVLPFGSASVFGAFFGGLHGGYIQKEKPDHDQR